MNPHIIFEDEDILVIDKPAGWIVNKADTTKGEKTIQDWLQEKFSIFNFQYRGGIVHRLDKETSGVLIVSKNPQSFDNLKMQFKERRVKKVYTALAHGKVEPETGEINVPVGRLPWNRMRFGVLAGGREAVTRYRVISNFILRLRSGQISNSQEDLSLLELYPETGRTHQIRVHLKHINHPIFADELYAGRKTARDDRNLLSRMFLHASKITIFHPKTGKELSFESSLPKELEEFLFKLS